MPRRFQQDAFTCEKKNSRLVFWSLLTFHFLFLDFSAAFSIADGFNTFISLLVSLHFIRQVEQDATKMGRESVQGNKQPFVILSLILSEFRFCVPKILRFTPFAVRRIRLHFACFSAYSATLNFTSLTCTFHCLIGLSF